MLCLEQLLWDEADHAELAERRLVIDQTQCPLVGRLGLGL